MLEDEVKTLRMRIEALESGSTYVPPDNSGEPEFETDTSEENEGNAEEDIIDEVQEGAGAEENQDGMSGDEDINQEGESFASEEDEDGEISGSAEETPEALDEENDFAEDVSGVTEES